MAIIAFTPGTSVAFDETQDTLNVLASASGTTFQEVGGNLQVTTSQGTMTLLGVTLAQLSITNVNFAGGGQLAIGDEGNGDALDSLANDSSIDTSDADNQFRGLGGNDTIDADDGDNLVYGGGGLDQITLSDGNNTVYGGDDSSDGADAITVGTGGGALYGNGGNDTFVFGATLSGQSLFVHGGAGNDTVSDGAAVVGSSLTIAGGLGADTLTINSALGNVVIYGGNPLAASADDGADTIVTNTGTTLVYGNSGSDTVTLGATALGNTATVFLGLGDDTLTSGAAVGNQTISGNLGSDNINVSGATISSDAVIFGGDALVSVDDAADTIVSGTGNIVAYGNAGGDTITVTPGLNKSANVFGGQGNDTINATPGDATAVVSLTGGLGDDRFVVNLGAGEDATIRDFLTGSDVAAVTIGGGASAAGTTLGRGGSSTVLQVGTSELTFANFLGNFSATNLLFADGSALVTNFGNAAATLTATAAGADQLVAGSNGDTFSFTSAGLTLADRVTGGAGADRLTTTDAATIVDADFTLATSLESVLLGNFAAQAVTLGALAQAAGITSVNGAALTGANAVTVTSTMTTNLSVTGGEGGDSITTAGGNDTIVTGNGANTVVTGAGTDSITLGANADSATAGAGNDSITSQGGVDTYIFDTRATNGLDTITMEAGDTDGSAIDDVFNFTANAAFIGTTTEDIVIVTDADLDSGDVLGAAGDNIVILTGSFFADAAALNAAITTDLSGLDAGQVLVLYSSSAGGDVRIAVVDVAANGQFSGAVDSAVLPGLTIGEAATGFANGNFVLD